MRMRLRVAAGALAMTACLAASVGALATTGGAPQELASAGSSAPTIVKELRRLRTDTSETYLLSDGTRATKIASAPQHYERPSGAYSPLEPRFRRRSGRFEARVASAELALPQRLGTEPVRVRAGSSWLAMMPRGTSAGSVNAGETVRYRSAWRSTDLHYSATTYGLKEELVLTRADAPRRFAFALTTSGDLRAKRSSDGHVVLRRRGKPVLQIGAPFMVDAAGRYAPSSSARLTLKRAGAKRVLALVLSDRWLSSPKRRFPVVVDPTVYPAVGVDSTIIDGTSANTQFSSASTLEVGRSSSNQMRSLLQFNTQAIPSNASVLGATLSLNVRSAPTSGGPSQVSIHAVTRQFTSNVTWRQAASGQLWTQPGADHDPAAASTRSAPFTPNTTASWAVTDLVTQWIDGTVPNNGVLLKGPSTSPTGVVKFGSNEYSLKPSMTVTWSPRGGLLEDFTYVTKTLDDGSDLSVDVASGRLWIKNVDFPALHAGVGEMGQGAGTELEDLAASRIFTGSRHGAEFAGLTTQFSFGFGIDVRLATSDDGAKIFYAPDGRSFRFRRNADGTFTPPHGERAELVETSPNDYSVFLESTGDTYVFADLVSGSLAPTEHRAENGATTRYTYGPNGLTMTDHAGRDYSFSYAYGNLESVHGPDGTRRYEISGNHYDYGWGSFLTAYVSTSGRRTDYSYNGSGNLSAVVPTGGRRVDVTYDGTGRVSTLVEAGIGVTRFEYAAGETLVTAPSGARTRYRFDPRDGSVLWVQEEPSHDLRVDGRIPELADRYDAGTDPLEAVIEAAGAQGVRSVGLEIDGVVRATEAVDCTAGCPSAFDADLAVPSSGLTEGRHVARARAESPSGQLSLGEPLVFFIDRSAPAPPAGFSAVHDAATGVLQVAWDVPADPVLADGSPGSGIREFIYRYRVDGSAWSDWLETADPTFAVTAGHVGSAVTVEVRARDDVGRESALGGASVIAGEADVGADASFWEEDVEAEGFDAAAPVIGLRCFIGNPGDVPRVRPVHAGERRIVIETDVNAYCRAANPSSPRQQEAAALATLSMRVCVEVEDPSWRNLDCKRGRKTGTRIDNKLSVTAAELCRPGAKRYRTSADITVKGPGIQYIGTRGPSATEAVSLGCNEAGAWRRLATRSGSPGRLLGNALVSEGTPFEDRDALPQGDSSLGPRRGWEAHHIVPGGEGRVLEGRKGIANDAQALAYTCDIGPNEGVNGVWLRGRFLLQGMPGYNTLDDAGKQRPAHGNVHTVRYYRWVRDNLHRYASYTGSCRSRTGARSALRTVRDEIISGEFPH